MLSAGSAYVTVKPLFNKSTWASAGKVAATGLVALTTAAVGVVKVGGEYVDSLNKIQALTGATDARMSKAARTLESQSSLYAKMGQTVGDAASGVVELTKAGLSLDDALKAVNATMVLAKAGDLSVADASSLVANTLNTFNLKATQAADVANYLANAANISSADVSDLAESFKYVAPVAAASHVSLKQTNAILAELSNSGIAASNAGTGFRKFLLSLQAPSGAAAKDLKALGVEIFDAHGKMKPLGDVIDVLNSKLSKLTDKERQRVLKTVFGLTGLTSAQVILKNGSKGLEEYTKGVSRAGAAQKLAQSASRGFTGTLKALRAEVISDAQAAYRKLSPALDDGAKKLLTFIQQMKSGKGAGGDFVDALQAIATVGKTVLGFFNGLPGPVKKYGAELLIAGIALNKINNGLVTGRLRFTNWLGSFGPAEGQMTRTTRASYALGVGLRNLAGAGGMLAIMDGTKRSNKALGTLETTLGAAAAGFAVGGPVGAGIGTGIGLFFSLKSAIAGTNDVKMPTPKQLGITDIIGALDDADAAATRFNKNQIFDFLSGKTKGAPPVGMTVGTTISATAKLYGIPDRQIVQAMTGNVKAFEAIKARFAKAAKHDPLGVVPTDRAAVLGSIRTTLTAYRAEREQVLKNIAATTDYGHKLDALPDKKQTKVEAVGIVPTVKGIAQVAAKIHATPDEIKTLISASGVNTTVGAVQRVIDKTKEYGRQHPVATVDANTKPARQKVASWITDLNRFLSGNFTMNIGATTSGPKVAGKRALGGRVQPGLDYLVGEHRAEIFRPDRPGTILPNIDSLTAPDGLSRLDVEQGSYRGFSRALAANRAVIVAKDQFDALDLLVGSG